MELTLGWKACRNIEDYVDLVGKEILQRQRKTS